MQSRKLVFLPVSKCSLTHPGVLASGGVVLLRISGGKQCITAGFVEAVAADPHECVK